MPLLWGAERAVQNEDNPLSAARGPDGRICLNALTLIRPLSDDFVEICYRVLQSSRIHPKPIINQFTIAA
jgi:hypothetical protein